MTSKTIRHFVSKPFFLEQAFIPLHCMTTSTLLLFLLFTNQLQSQDGEIESPVEDVIQNETILEPKSYKAFTAGGHLKNMHIWHGFIVHHGALFATNLEFNTKNKRVYIWLLGRPVVSHPIR